MQLEPEDGDEPSRDRRADVGAEDDPQTLGEGEEVCSNKADGSHCCCAG